MPTYNIPSVPHDITASEFETMASTRLNNLQPKNANLDAISALTTTAYGRALLTAADAAALRAASGTAIGTNVQAFSDALAEIAALADPGTDKYLGWDDTAGAWAWFDPSTGGSGTTNVLGTAVADETAFNNLLITAVANPGTEYVAILTGDIVLAAPRSVPTNVLVMRGPAGRFTDSGGTLTFLGVGLADPLSRQALFYGFASGDVTWTGTDHPKAVSTALWDTASSSVSARVIRASAALTGKTAKIVAFEGTITELATLKAGHHLHFTDGDYTNTLATTLGNGNRQVAFVLESNTRVSGDPNAFIYESPTNNYCGLFYASAMSPAVSGWNTTNENIIVEHLNIVGDEAQTNTAGQEAGIHLGNCQNGVIRFCKFVRTHSYVCSVGGYGTTGNYAYNCRVHDNSFIGCGTQVIALFNCKNIWLERNLFDLTDTTLSSTYVPIDIEPNDENSIMENIWIEGNKFDYTSENVGGKYANSIAIQPVAIDCAKNITIRNNEVLGPEMDTVAGGGDPSNWPVNVGVDVYGVQGLTLEGNFVRRATGKAYSLRNCRNVKVINNTSELGGDSTGNNSALTLSAVSNAIVRDNTFMELGLGGEANGINEDEVEMLITAASSTVTKHASETTNNPYTLWEGLTVTINATDYTVDQVAEDTATKTFTTTASVGTLTVVSAASATDINTTTNKITATAHPFNNGARLRYVQGTTPITASPALANGATVFVVNKGANDFEIALTEGGAALDLTGAGTGTQTFVPVARTKFSSNRYVNNYAPDGIAMEQTGTSQILSTAFDNATTVVTGDHTVTPSDGAVAVNHTVAADITLYSAAGRKGKRHRIFDAAGVAEEAPITITPASGSIMGGADLTIAVNNGWADLISDGTDWLVAAHRLEVIVNTTFTPADLTNIIARWKASEMTGFSDNDTVSTWAAFGFGGDLTATAGEEPIYKANAGDPYVEFDGTDDFMTATIASLTDYTVFAIWERVSTGSYDRLIDSTNNGLRVNQNDTANSQSLHPAPNPSIVVATPAPPSGFMAMTASRIGTAGNIRIAGTATAGTVSDANTSGTTLYVGSDHTGAACGNVRIKELVLMDGGFAANEFTWLKQYVTREYGLTL